MGVYSTSQFMGAFVGGVLGGALLARFGEQGVYIFVALVCFAWLLVAAGMARPNPETGMTISFDAPYDAQQAERLSAQLSKVKGVEEVVAIPGERLAYLKVVKSELDLENLRLVQASIRA